METETRSRPELRPVWTGHGDQPQLSPRTTALSATSPLYSASLSLPSPMHPISPGYDPMRAHERALVDKLDRGRRESQLSPTTARSLSPISEQTPDARRGSTASLPLPRAPAPSPLSPTLMQYTGPQTLAARTREILLGGMPDGLPRSPLAFSSTSAIDERRQSLPPPPPSGGRRNSQQIRNDLRQWGHVYYGDSTIADCFVSAVSAVTSRKNSESSSTDGDGVPLERSSEGSNQVTIRVRVRPCALNREPFLLTRTLDMDRLRATIPEPPPLSAGPQRRASEVPIVPTRSPLPTSRRRSSVAAGAKHGLGPDRSHVQNTSTVPIHAPYARAYFPVLAVILYSGHIEKGDIIQLPMPNPKAWARTVAYVYTGQGELTEAIKQNIEHLGGKV